MLKEEIYAIGYPAREAYPPFIEFVMKYANKDDKILDVGGGEGAYSAELNKQGFSSTCVDICNEYIIRSNNRGVNSYVMDATSLSFPDKSFDIILLLEALEHIRDVDAVLKQAKRVGKKYILITVPNCSGFEDLKRFHLTYDHFLATDHVNFFTRKDLENLLSNHFKNFIVEENEPIKLGAVGLPWFLRKPILLLHRLKFIKINIYYRLFAIIDLKEE